jgi:hypothetical protein
MTLRHFFKIDGYVVDVLRSVYSLIANQTYTCYVHGGCEVVR